MEDRAISLKAVIEAIDVWDSYAKTIKRIKELPSVKSQEPKTGQWIGEKAYPICGECGCNIYEEYITCQDYAEICKPMKFCPNCGAKMVEEQESEDK